MTTQYSDIVWHRGRPHTLAGISGPSLFDLTKHGFVPYAWSSACHFGCYCTYHVENSLVLTQVNLGLNEQDTAQAERGEGATLFGKIPQRYSVEGHSVSLRTGKVQTIWVEGDFKVDGLRELVRFTGGLLIGDGFIRELNMSGGFHPPYTFREVHELRFQDGWLTEHYDRSDELAEVRRAIPTSANSESSSMWWALTGMSVQLDEQAKRCFTGEYRFVGTGCEPPIWPQTYEFHCPECQKGLERSKRNECSNCGWLKFPTPSREKWNSVGSCPLCGFSYRWDGSKCSHCGRGCNPELAT